MVFTWRGHVEPVLDKLSSRFRGRERQKPRSGVVILQPREPQRVTKQGAAESQSHRVTESQSHRVT
eukprot:8101258-Pyramimonas_sp.AAC.1